MGLGAILLFILIGAGVYVSSNQMPAEENGKTSISEEAITEFTEEMRAGTVARVGQPIEGFEPFMFIQAFPGLEASDFNNVDALIGLYRYENGEVVYDLNGEVEIHSAARAISDEGMLQLLVTIAARLNVDLEGEATIGDLIAVIEPAEEVGEQDGGQTIVSPASGERIAIEGTITCLPHKGDGPHTMECAFGLQGDDGLYYGLSNLWAAAPELTDTNVHVVVTGTFNAPLPNETYDIVGYIEVESAEKQ